MIFFGEVGHGPRTNQLDFVGDPGQHPDRGFLNNDKTFSRGHF